MAEIRDAARPRRRFGEERKRNPSVSELVADLKVCCRSRDLEKGRRIHAQAKESGSDGNIFVANSLIDMYAKIGSMPDARSVFDNMKKRSLVSWNTLVLGYAQGGEPELALELFEQMRGDGFLPDSCSFVAALKASTVLAERDQWQRKQLPRKSSEKVFQVGVALERAVALHAFVANSGHELNLFVASSLVNLYCKVGSVAEAVKVFERMRQKSVVTWNSIIIGCAQNGEPELAMSLFLRMQDEQEVVPDCRTFVAALEACIGLADKEQALRVDMGEVLVKMRSLEKGMEIHSQAARRGHTTDMFVANTLIDMYSKCGVVDDALQVFNTMQSRDVVSWNVMMLSLALSGQEHLALTLFQRMQHKGRAESNFVEPDSRTYVAALKACSSLAAREVPTQVEGELVKVVNLERGFAIHSQVADSIHRSDVFIANAMLDLYSKCGSLAETRRVFYGMLQRTVVSWNTVILGHAQGGANGMALDFFAQIKDDAVKPDSLTYVAALKACGNLAALSSGRKIHIEVMANPTIDLENDTFLATALVDFYGKCGSIDEALQVFNSIRKKDSVAWGALTAGFSQKGDTEGLFQVVETMKQQRVEIDAIVFLHILTACSHAGLVDRGKEFFQLMFSEDHGVAPSVEHYTCMVDLLARANHLEEAVATVRSMPFEPDATVWTSIMNACRKWNNVEIGKIAFDSMMRLDAKDPGAYALMANTFCDGSTLSQRVD